MDLEEPNDHPTELPLAAAPLAPELSLLMVQLLKGVLYREDDDRLWASLLRLQARVREQGGLLLLDLVLDEADDLPPPAIPISWREVQGFAG